MKNTRVARRIQNGAVQATTVDRRHRPTRLILPILLGVFLVIGGSALWVLHQASVIKTNLNSSVVLLEQLRTEINSQNYEGSAQLVQQLSEHTNDARNAASDPLWRAASYVPYLGPNFTAVTEIAVSADDIVQRAGGPLIQKFAGLDSSALTPVDGRINIEAIQDLAPTLVSAANTVQLSFDRLEGIDSSKLINEIATPLSTVTDDLNELRGPLNALADASSILPEMLGSEGDRKYLVLIQNSAETRATGGIPGALAVLSASDGHLDLVAQDSAANIGALRPPLEVDPVQEQIYTNRLGRQFQNVNLTPDFPTVGDTSKRMWERTHQGSTIDGVVALDPVVLSYLLEATGPLSLEGGVTTELLVQAGLPTDLTAENVVPSLLSTVYAQLEEPREQDAYFSAVAQTVFAAFSSGQGGNNNLLQAVIRSADEDRLRIWSAHAPEQDLLAANRIGGSMSGEIVSGATFGLYFNDGTGAKMDYYMERTAHLTQQCMGNGFSRYSVQVNIANTAPLDAAESLPTYVTGGGAYDVEAGHVRTNYVAYGPAQALVETATLDGTPVPISAFRHGQRPVGVVAVELGPGESAVLEMVFSNVVQASVAELRVTPTIQSLAESVLPSVRDASCG